MGMKDYASYGIGMCLDERTFAELCDTVAKGMGLTEEEFDMIEYSDDEILDLNDGWASGITTYNVKTEETEELERLYVFYAKKPLAVFAKDAYNDISEIVKDIRDRYSSVIPADFPVEDFICEYSASVLV